MKKCVCGSNQFVNDSQNNSLWMVSIIRVFEGEPGVIYNHTVIYCLKNASVQTSTEALLIDLNLSYWRKYFVWGRK